jgi:4-alpha-glucanotransferase
MKFERASGILLHPTSLPSPYGIGDLGPAAYRWVDWLTGTGCKLWQVLPLGPTGYGDSPYQCFSAFAGNPYLISPELLLRDDLLHSNDLIEVQIFNPGRVDFGALIPWKLNLLERAYIRFSTNGGFLRSEYDTFCSTHSAWLEDYALFMAIKEAQGGGAWDGWPEPLRKRDPKELEDTRRTLIDSVSRYRF